LQTLVDGTERYFTAANFNADGTQLATVSFQWHIPHFEISIGIISESLMLNFVVEMGRIVLRLPIPCLYYLSEHWELRM